MKRHYRILKILEDKQKSQNKLFFYKAFCLTSLATLVLLNGADILKFNKKNLFFFEPKYEFILKPLVGVT